MLFVVACFVLSAILGMFLAISRSPLGVMLGYFVGSVRFSLNHVFENVLGYKSMYVCFGNSVRNSLH